MCENDEAAGPRVDSSSVMAMSPMPLNLRLDSFSKQRRNSVTTSRGVSVGSCDQSGSLFNTSAIKSLAVFP
jgi:hypothetical protein